MQGQTHVRFVELERVTPGYPREWSRVPHTAHYIGDQNRQQQMLKAIEILYSRTRLRILIDEKPVIVLQPSKKKRPTLNFEKLINVITEQQ